MRLFQLIVFLGFGLFYFYGIIYYGDNVEDEWFIVYFFWEFIKFFFNFWVCVFDSDGEFFLIEVVKVLFKWFSLEDDIN